MVLGVYITYKLLDIADLTVDGSFALGGCVCAVMVLNRGMDPWAALIVAAAAGMVAGAVTGFLHTVFEIPAILAGILTQIDRSCSRGKGKLSRKWRRNKWGILKRVASGGQPHQDDGSENTG